MPSVMCNVYESVIKLTQNAYLQAPSAKCLTQTTINTTPRIASSRFGSSFVENVEESPFNRNFKLYFLDRFKDCPGMDSRIYRQFVVLRIGEILESSSESNLKLLEPKLNVADEGTNWQKVPSIDISSRWFSRPDFLYKSKINSQVKTV